MGLFHHHHDQPHGGPGGPQGGPQGGPGGPGGHEGGSHGGPAALAVTGVPVILVAMRVVPTEALEVPVVSAVPNAALEAPVVVTEDLAVTTAVAAGKCDEHLYETKSYEWKLDFQTVY